MDADDDGDVLSASWSGDHYAEHTAHHRAYDSVLLDRLRPVPDDATIVDVGCGVGDFTAGLTRLVPRGHVLGIDADPSMIATARGRSDAAGILAFAVLPAQQLAQAADAASVTAIVSTACLHWVPKVDQPRVLDGARRILVPGGQWCVEFGGAGQLASMRAVLDPIAVEFGGSAPAWFFPTVEEYGELLDDAGFGGIEVELLHQRRAMADEAALRGLLTSQVLHAYLPDIEQRRREEFVGRACDGVVSALRAAAPAEGPVDFDVEYVRVVASAVNP